jgi:hypothetical protein
MIKGKEKLLEHFKASEMPHWYIYLSKDTKSGSYFGKAKDIEGLGMIDSEEQLRLTLSRMTPGTRYYVVFKNKPDSSRGYIETTFENDSETVEIKNAIHGNNYSHEDIESITSKKVSEAIAIYQKQQEHEQLKKELEETKKELRRNKPGVIESRIAGFMDQYPQIMHGLFGMLSNAMPQPATTRIAGFENQNTTMKNNVSPNEVSEDNGQERLEKALTVWQQADPEGFLTVIEKLSHIASTKKEAYNSYKPLLLSF